MTERRRQAGFSLPGLLVASVIGLFLTAIVIRVYVSGRATHDHYRAISAAAENGRFALEDIRRTLMMAGRGLPPNAAPWFAFGRYGSADGPADGVSDTLAAAYRYPGAASCSGGREHNDDTILRNRFEVTEGSGPAPIRQLSCRVNGGRRTAIVHGIENLQALYGVDSDGDGYADRYLAGGAVETAGLWRHVVAVRVGVLAGSPGYRLPITDRPPRPAVFTVLDRRVTAADTEHAYRLLVSTVALRNLIGTERQPGPVP